jgi:exopolysaccharide biosynthesis polyprenyl glycosylphosphotransferase
MLFVALPLTLLAIQALGGYLPLVQQSRTRIAVCAVIAPIIGLGGIAVVLFALRSPNWSRLLIFCFTALCSVFIGTYRYALRWYRLRRIASGFYARNILLIGPTQALEWLSIYFSGIAPLHYRVTGYLDLPNAGRSPTGPGDPDAKGQLRRVGDVEEFGSILVHNPIHEVVAVCGVGSDEWLRQVIEHCDYFRVVLRIIPETLLFGQLRDLQYIYRSDALRLPEIVLVPRDLASDKMFLKRMIDIVVSSTLLVLLLPLFAVIALAIKISTPDLPIFYPWRVVGSKGRRFTGYKFSTMVADADLRRDELMAQNEMQGPVFKIKADPRVTSVGRILRKFSLNELPQLWSVLKGDMSLVGPRPAFPHELERYQMWHKRKLCVRPGITCLWQVRGRNRISDFDDWVRMDLEYIDNWSLWLDMKILMRTAWTLVRGTGW